MPLEEYNEMLRSAAAVYDFGSVASWLAGYVKF